MEDQYIAGGLNRSAVQMSPDQKRAAFDAFLPARSVGRLQPRAFQRPRDTTRQMPGCLANRRRERSVRDDWSYARHEYRNRSNEVRAKLSEPRRSPGIFDLGTWRSSGRLCKRTLFVVRPRHDRHTFARDTEFAQIPGRTSSGGGIIEQGHYQYVGHLGSCNQ